ncbi:MaoC family dehydratase [Vineibacter terrae]|uniref:MaoC family dehydratase n=1 Tax=Vineibacter terrae TaxID=2586908 RepID=A0A5C8PS69_9HYPH|nr:MaoC family dehydratase [Vineibacter terrae]TXL79515.1 MaoC family dehydratase [Vineibacter terrae]
MTQAAEDFRARARLVPKGHTYDDFTPGRVFSHHWGRTITESESTTFTTLTLHFNPHYYNAEYARAHGHPGLVVNPLLVFTTVFGLSVEDLSEGGGPFLGVNELSFHSPVYPGDTLTARSLVLDRRLSDSMKDFGIVTWHTEGFNQADERVIDFKRTNLVRLRRVS